MKKNVLSIIETDLEYGKDDLGSSCLDGDERDCSRWSGGLMIHSGRNVRRNGSQSYHLGGAEHSSLPYQPTISEVPLILLLSTEDKGDKTICSFIRS